MLISPPDHGLPDGGTVRDTDLGGLRLIVSQYGTFMRRFVDDLIARRHRGPHRGRSRAPHLDPDAGARRVRPRRHARRPGRRWPNAPEPPSTGSNPPGTCGSRWSAAPSDSPRRRRRSWRWPPTGRPSHSEAPIAAIADRSWTPGRCALFTRMRTQASRRTREHQGISDRRHPRRRRRPRSGGRREGGPRRDRGRRRGRFAFVVGGVPLGLRLLRRARRDDAR